MLLTRRFSGCWSIALIFCPALFAQSGSYLITTVAGNGTPGFGGDSGPATSASLYYPWGVAVDTSGDLFIADPGNNRVREVSNGVITTVAGTGTAGFSGDGGPATSAELWSPQGVAVDAAGNIYIADLGNQRIRMVSNGVITTVAGNGRVSYGFSGDGGAATAAELSDPESVAVDASGNLYIADSGAASIVKVANGVITMVAGLASGAYGFSGDGGPATSAELGYPTGVAVDASGNVFIADYYNQRIRMVTPQGRPAVMTITTVAGNGQQGFGGDGGPATSALLNGPSGVAVDASGNLFIVDSQNNRIRMLTPQGIISTVAGDGTLGSSGDGGPATAGELNFPVTEPIYSLNFPYQYPFSVFGYPSGVAIDASGNIFIPDTANNRIRHLVPVATSTAGCVYSIDQSSQSFAAAGGTSSVGVLASESTCPWLSISYTGWMTLSAGGVASGTGLVIETISPNPDSASRTSTLWVAGESVTVTQSGVVCSLGVSPLGVSVAASGVTGATLTVTSNAPDCQWTAGANVPWILVSGGSPGTGSGTVTFTVGINTGDSRTGGITAAGQVISVNQYSACDIDSNGATNVAEVQLMINEALGLAPPLYDLNYDGVVNMADIQIVINAALSLGCAWQ